LVGVIAEIRRGKGSECKWKGERVNEREREI